MFLPAALLVKISPKKRHGTMEKEWRPHIQKKKNKNSEKENSKINSASFILESVLVSNSLLSVCMTPLA